MRDGESESEGRRVKIPVAVFKPVCSKVDQVFPDCRSSSARWGVFSV